MTVPVFAPVSNPSYNYTTYETEYSVLEAGFGDNYSQRTGTGLNNEKRTATLSWDVAPNSEADTYQSFFKSLGGVQPFDYTLPGETVQMRWVCKKQRRVPTGFQACRYEATLERVFDL